MFGRLVFRRTLWDLILEGPDMVREEARRTLLGEYDKWAKDHPEDVTKRGGWSFSRICKRKDWTFSISTLLVGRFRVDAGFYCHWRFDRLYTCSGGESSPATHLIIEAARSGCRIRLPIGSARSILRAPPHRDRRR